MRLLARDIAVGHAVRENAPTAVAVRAQHKPTPVSNVASAAGASVRALPLRQSVDAPLSSAAQRDRAGWLKDLGLDPNHPDPVRAIAAAELARAQAIDPRVTADDMERVLRRSAAAAQITPAAQRVLYGFTRLIDAKLNLTSRSADTTAIDLLATAALASDGDPGALLGAINAGPGNGEQHIVKPQTRTELVAAIVRFALLGTATSLQIAISKELSDWLREVLTDHQIAPSLAMGGAGGFCANMASTLPNVQSRFYSADPIPGAMADRFAPGVSVIDAAGAPAGSAAVATNHDDARVNWAVDWSPGEAFTILGRASVLVDGKPRELKTARSARIILSTPAEERPGFALDDAALTRLAETTDKFFGVGPHYLTKGSAEHCRETASELARQYRLMCRSNPKLLMHHQYVVPKVEANEGILMDELAGSVSSTALNASELPALVERLAAGGLVSYSGHIDAATADDPSVQVDAALALKNGMGLRRVHIHGFLGDLVVKDGNPDPERILLASLRARQIAAVKTASDSGEIKTGADVTKVTHGVRGYGLAAVQRFADAIERRFGLTPLERDLVAQRWWYRDAQGTAYVFTPTRGVHAMTGGKVSLGDCIDNGQILYEDPPAKPSVPPGVWSTAARARSIT